MSVHQLIADIEAWNCYAARMNAKALAAGLVTAEELARDRERARCADRALQGNTCTGRKAHAE